MCAHVGLEVCSLGEGGWADWAGEEGLRAVEQLVDGESSGLAESLATLLTLMGLLLGVRVHVISEMILSLEGFVTLGAGERPLSRVNPLMDLKIVSL